MIGTLRTFLVVVAGFATASGAFAQSAEPMPPRKASPLTVRQVHSGHSLTDTYVTNPWPGRLIEATALRTGDQAHRTIINSTVPGAPLHWRWNNVHQYGVDARVSISQFELLVTTEAVPLPEPEWFQKDTLAWLDKWVEHAGRNGDGGKGAEVLLYTTWTHWRYPTMPQRTDLQLPFRQRLDHEGKLWELMQDTANANRPESMPLIYLIPGHRLMMRIYDDIKAGVAPGLTNIGEIFADDIHLNSLGQYAITCLVYAVIYQRDPRELPPKLSRKADMLTREQADYFKQIAWEVPRSYPRSGVPAN